MVLLAAVAGVIAVNITILAFSRSRWGPKTRASIREFHRTSYNPPPPDWSGSTFKPKLDYPTAFPTADEKPPWTMIDFKREPEKYLETVLEYCYDGNVKNDFVPQKNPKRQWFHAPWMCQTPIGREPIHGLTFERPAPASYPVSYTHLTLPTIYSV